MKSSTKTCRVSGCRSLLVALVLNGLLFLAIPAQAAIQWFDSGTAAGIQPATGTTTNVAWGTDNIWASTNAGTTTPSAWTPNNDAYFTAAGTATVTVNNVSAGMLNFSAGTWFFLPGTGPLTINGGITNSQNITFGNDIALGGNQTWYLSGNTMTVTGKVSGAYALTKTGAAGTLALSNDVLVSGGLIFGGTTLASAGTVKTVSGTATLPFGNGNIVLNNGTLALTPASGNAAYLGVTNAGSTFTFGTNATLQTAAASGSTLSYTIGTNGAAADSVLLRAGKGTMILAFSGSGKLGNTEQVIVNGGVSMLNGMVAPYLVGRASSGDYEFLSYGASYGFTNVVYDSTNSTSGGSSTTKIKTTTANLTLVGNLTGYVAKVGSSAMNLNGYQLVLGDGVNPTALSMAGGITNGTIVVNGNTEILVPTVGTSVIGAEIQGTGLLNQFGTGTLILSNANLYGGPILTEAGGVTFSPTADATFAKGVDGPGTLTKTGPNTVTYTGTNSLLANFTLNGGSFVISGGVMSNQAATFTSGLLVVSNSGFFRVAGTTLSKSSDTNLLVTGSGSILDAAAGNVIVGNGSVTGNVMIVERGGTVTNAQLDVGGGSGSPNGNSLLITNGGRFIGSGSTLAAGRLGSSNSIVIAGANGGAPAWLNVNGGSLFVGISTGTGNWIRVDSGGVITNVGGQGLTVGGAAGSFGNSLLVINGGRADNIGFGLYVGKGLAANQNFLLVTNGGVVSLGTSQTLSIGAFANGMTGNYVRVDNGIVSNVLSISIGTKTNSVGNSLTIANGGQVLNGVGGSVIVGGPSGGDRNSVLIQDRGLLEVGSLMSNYVGGVGNTISNIGGFYQFTTATPTIVPNGFGNITLSNGWISFRGINNADVMGSLGSNQLANISFSGSNTFRLNNSSNTSAASPQSYTFGGSSPSNYVGLEMINGGTEWKSSWLNIGNNGTMLVSNTSASILGVVTNLGAITVANASATWSNSVVLNGGNFLVQNSTNAFNQGLSVGSAGAFTVTNGVSRISGTLTNAGIVNVVNARAVFSSNVVNLGAWVSDPSTNTFNGNYTVGPTGYVSAASNDVYAFGRDFILQSTNRAAFNMAQARVVFATNGYDLATTTRFHTLNLTNSGAMDMGSNWLDHLQLQTNFSIGTLTISLSNQLTITGVKGTNALYVGVLDLSAWNTNAGNLNATLLAALNLPDVNVYYDKFAAENAYLQGLEFSIWTSGGLLIPIPEPSPFFAVGAGLAFLAFLRRRKAA